MTITPPNGFQRDASRLTIIAGPCLVESADIVQRVADHLVHVCRDLPIQLIFKGSYRKANRTSASGFSGIGDQEALSILASVRTEFGIPVLTDIHADDEAAMAAEAVDVLQIPAFLARQTSLLHAAAKTMKTVNIKKAQFMAPEDVVKAAAKVVAAGNNNIMLTERGTSFGYHDLIVDFRGFPVMRASGFPLIFDATHSLQQPSIGESSGGKREYIYHLARAAAACGVDGIFFETHPDPANAKSDAATQLPLDESARFIDTVLKHWSLTQQG